MDWLLQLDRDLLRFINFDLGNFAFDFFFVGLTDFHKTMTFKLIFLPLIVFLAWKTKKAGGVMTVFGLAITLGANDLLCSKVIKVFFHRLRPNVAGLDVILRSAHYGGYSFASNHASNMFCFAVFLSSFYPRFRWPLFLLAGLVAFSRVYVGVHYPSDVLGGAIIGSLIGWVGASLFKKFLDWKDSQEVQNG